MLAPADSGHGFWYIVPLLVMVGVDIRSRFRFFGISEYRDIGIGIFPRCIKSVRSHVQV